MTILIFTSGILTIATPSWAATEIMESQRQWVQVHMPIFGSASLQSANFEMSLAEFLRVVAEGGKVVDLRGLQGPSGGNLGPARAPNSQ